MVICASINSLKNLHNQCSPLKQTKKEKKKEIHIMHSIIDLLYDTPLLFCLRTRTTE